MIEKSILGLGLDVDRHIFIDWQKRRSYGIGRYIFFFFFFVPFFECRWCNCRWCTYYLLSSSYYVYGSTCK